MTHYRCACGLDVHKDLIVASIASFSPSGSDLLYSTLEFSNDHFGLSKLCLWIKEHNVEIVAMESTGKYHFSAFYYLSKVLDRVNVCNPKYLKSIKGSKTDLKDSRRIAHLAIVGMANNASLIPSPEIRDLRGIHRLLRKSIQQKATLTNRLKGTLRQVNVTLDNHIKDCTCNSSLKVLNYFVDCNGNVNEKTIKALLASATMFSKKTDVITDSLRYHTLTNFGFFSLRCLLEELFSCLQLIEQLSDKLISFSKSLYPNSMKIITSCGFIGDTSAASILAEIGGGIYPFPNCKKFISWCGLAPGSDQSNVKLKSRHIGKGGYYLKPLLIQLASLARRQTKRFDHKFRILHPRIGYKKAIVAIARKIMVCLYFMLKRNECFDDSIDITEIDENLITPDCSFEHEIDEDGVLLDNQIETDKAIPKPTS